MHKKTVSNQSQIHLLSDQLFTNQQPDSGAYFFLHTNPTRKLWIKPGTYNTHGCYKFLIKPSHTEPKHIIHVRYIGWYGNTNACDRKQYTMSSITIVWYNVNVCQKFLAIHTTIPSNLAASHQREMIINSSPPGDAYMHQWTALALVQVIARPLFGAKPSPETMLTHCQLDSCEQISVKFQSEFYNFHSRKCIWNCRLPMWRPLWPEGRWVNNINGMSHPGQTDVSTIDEIAQDTFHGRKP